MRVSARLNAICSEITKCVVFADVGCDHGYVAEYVLKNGLAESVIASDISADSLKKAENRLIGYKNINFLVSDGFKSYNTPPSQAVISGMGGYTVIDILKNTAFKPRLILSPQSDIDKVRVFLKFCGYRITSDYAVREGSKFYFIICAEKGISEIDGLQALFGTGVYNKNKVLAEYLGREKEKYQNYPPTDYNLQMLSAVKEALKWQK